MVINVVAGHSAKAPGASGYLDEVTEDRLVKNDLVNILKSSGHTVYDCTSDANDKNTVLSQQVSACNNHAGLDVHIHFNAGGGKGSEVWVYNSTSKSNNYAPGICKQLETLGFKNRGVKESTGLYVLKRSNNPALLVEVCFVDTQSDSTLYKSKGHYAVAQAIAKGIVGTIASSTTNKTAAPSVPKPKLKKGYIGNTKAKVKQLQQCLNYVIGAGLDVDGSFGNLTKIAVIKFQAKYGLDQDGSYGPKSYAKMLEVCK